MSTTKVSAPVDGADANEDPPAQRTSWVDIISMSGAVVGTAVALLQLLKDGPTGAVVAGVVTAALGAFVLGRVWKSRQPIAAGVSLVLALGGAGLAGAGVDRVLTLVPIQPAPSVAAPDPTIHIMNPMNGQSVDQSVTVSGIATNAAGRHVWAYVELPDGRRYFGKCTPGMVDQNGFWAANTLNVGQPGDAGLAFTLGALLVNEEAHKTLDGLCSRNDLSGKRASDVPVAPLAEITIRVGRK